MKLESNFISFLYQFNVSIDCYGSIKVVSLRRDCSSDDEEYYYYLRVGDSYHYIGSSYLVDKALTAQLLYEHISNKLLDISIYDPIEDYQPTHLEPLRYLTHCDYTDHKAYLLGIKDKFYKYIFQDEKSTIGVASRNILIHRYK